MGNEWMGKLLEKAIINSDRTYGVLKIEDDEKKQLEQSWSKFEIDATNSKTILKSMIELATLLRFKHNYTIDAEEHAVTLYFAMKFFRTYNKKVMAYYSPEFLPIFFEIEEEKMLVVAPKEC